MKQLFLLFAACFLILTSLQGQTRHKFYVDIYYESNIETITRFVLDQDRLKILDCSNVGWGCKTSKISFDKKLTKGLSDSIYSMLLKLKMDTLKAYYSFENTYEHSVYDGLYTHYIFSGDRIKYTKTTTYAISTLATDSLNSFLKINVIPNKYYFGLYIYGQ